MKFFTTPVMFLVNSSWMVDWMFDWLFWWRRDVEQLREKLDAAEAEINLLKSQLQTTEQRERLAKAEAGLNQARAKLNASEEELKQLAQAEEEITRLRAELAVSEQHLEKLTVAEQEINRLKQELEAKEEERHKLTAAEAEINRLQQELAVLSAGTAVKSTEVVVKKVPSLEAIHGVGPAFARRFYEAGVHTFDDLAALTPERVREIIAPKAWQKIDPVAWIEEAKKFAQEHEP